jgi:hypothetical protein
MKSKSIIESILFGAIAVPVFCIAMAKALDGSFRLHPGNVEYAAIRGVFFGVIIMFLVGGLQINQNPKLITASRIIGFSAEVILFIGTYLYVGAIASC